MLHRKYLPSPTLLIALAALATAASCTPKPDSRRPAGSAVRTTSSSDTAEMLEADFKRLDNLPSAFSLRLDPPAVLLDSRHSNDGKDVLVTISQSPGIENGPWNVLEVVSGNVNLRNLGVRPGDTVKCYLFPDSETRLRQQTTGEVDPQMVTHEATELIVAQVLDDLRMQVVGGVVPPRDLQVHIPEKDFAELTGQNIAQIDALREQGRVDAFGVKLPAAMLSLDQLAGLMPSVAWPPRIEIWRVQDDRMKAISRALGNYAKRGEPPLGWQPSPDAGDLASLTESFNRWLRSRKDIEPIAPPKLLGTLPDDLLHDERLQPFLSEEALNRNLFEPHEGRLIQEALWCRDISGWASGDAFDPLPRAERLFDWVVRNVTLTDSPRVTYHRPWQSLVYGQGTAAQRAWVFAQLCRQQRIDCCVIVIPPSQEGAEPWLWCGVVDHGQLYLFDPQLGLPISSGEGVATLAEVSEDDSLLRALDLPDSPYPLTSEMVKDSVAYVVADSMSLSNRALELEKQQSGSSAIVLHTDIDALSKRLAKVPGIGAVKLWAFPFENLRRELRLASADSALAEKTRSAAAIDFQPFAWVPHLWKARLLFFRGMVETERETRKKGVLHDPVNDHRAAAQLYLSPRVRPSERKLAEIAQDAERLNILHAAKADATYWLALLKYDQGEPRQSVQWLERDTLATEDAAHREIGALYNLARAYEALGDLPRAAELLESDDSPQRHGNRLRAARLRKQAEEKQASSS